MTTAKHIKEWFDNGVGDNQRWMVIICDTFDYEDFPSYFDETQVKECRECIRSAQHGENMQNLMEVYDLSMDKEKQFVAVKLVMNGPGR